MTKDDILAAIKKAAEALGHPPSKREFGTSSRVSEHQLTTHFLTWNDAVREAGYPPNESNVRIEDEQLLQDWAEVVRNLREIPTIVQYRHHGKYSPSALRRFGPWSGMPDRFRECFGNDPQYADVLALLPRRAGQQAVASSMGKSESSSNSAGVPRLSRRG